MRGEKKKKRGVIEVQFNWIFILIIGAVILLFFFGIVRTQKTVSEKKISITVKRDIRAILTGAGVSTGTTSLVEVPKTQIDFDCEGYSIQKTSPIKTLVSFSPDSIYDIKLMLWALDWNIGYRITNFLYITSPNIRYILVYRDNEQKIFVDIINETLPSKYTDEEIYINNEKKSPLICYLKIFEVFDEKKHKNKIPSIFIYNSGAINIISINNEIIQQAYDFRSKFIDDNFEDIVETVINYDETFFN